MLGTESLSSTKLPENVEIMVLDASSNLREDVGLEELPDCLSDKNALVWCDISATDRKGGPYWRLMTETFGFDQLTIEDCFSQSRLPLLNDYSSYLFMVLFSFGLPEEETPEEKKSRVFKAERTEVDLYLGKNYVVCVHSKPLPELDRVREGLRMKD